MLDSNSLSLFQSTLSVRRATRVLIVKRLLRAISIHALREESDVADGRVLRMVHHFNPRSP